MNPFGTLPGLLSNFDWNDPEKINRFPLGLLAPQPDVPAQGARPAGPAPAPQPVGAPMPLAGAAPATPTQQQNKPGILDMLGSIYGQGGPGDGLINLGLAVASPGNMATNVQKAMQMQAMNQMARSKQAQEQFKFAREQAGLQGNLEVLKRAYPGYTDQQLIGLAGNASAVQEAMKRVNPNETYRVETDAQGRQWQINGQTGQRSLLLDGNFQTVTDPAQRAALGVPNDYKGPVQVGSDGKLSMPGKAGVEVNMQGKFGTVPPGYQVKGDDATGYRMEPVPGSPAARELQETERKDREAQALKTVRSDIVIQDVDRIGQMVRNSALPSTGWTGSFLSQIKGTAQHDVANMLNTLKSITRIDTLQAMRAASPTGGALGNVSNQEGQMLEGALGALEQSQSQEQFERNLARFKELYLRTVYGPDAARSMLSPQGQQEQQTPTVRRRFNPQTGRIE